jgi:hypothetical protein
MEHCLAALSSAPIWPCQEFPDQAWPVCRVVTVLGGQFQARRCSHLFAEDFADKASCLEQLQQLLVGIRVH